ncbi:MAG: aldose epimerase family protein [Clostridiaceae bacterium]
MKVSVKHHNLRGLAIDEITIGNAQNMEVSFLNFGGIITKILVPDNRGKIENVVLAYKDYEGYLDNPAYFGAIIGRTAGRIKDGVFSINGKTYHLDKNYGPNSGQGGENGFDKKIFGYTIIEEDNSISVLLEYTSMDMEEGYPGEVKVFVTYSLNEENVFRIDYEAIPEEDTLINLTNHSYFNLSGNFEESIKYHELFIASETFLELDETSAPTGELLDTLGTPFDFYHQKEIGEDMEVQDPQLKIGNGYDHTFLLNKDNRVKVRLAHRFSGRVMEIETDNEAVVIYTQNYAQGQIIENGKELDNRKSVAIEIQRPPIGSGECFKDASIVQKNKIFKTYTSYCFFQEEFIEQFFF